MYNHHYNVQKTYKVEKLVLTWHIIRYKGTPAYAAPTMNTKTATI